MRKVIQVEKDGWPLLLLLVYNGTNSDRTWKKLPSKLGGCTYGRYLVGGALKLIGMAILFAVFCVFAAAATLVANFFTIVLGFGFAICSPGKDFLQVPFEIGKDHKRGSLAWFIIPFWIGIAIVAGLNFGFTRHPDEMREFFSTIGHIAVIVGAIVGAWVLIMALVELKKKFSNGKISNSVANAWQRIKARYDKTMEAICPIVELVDPPPPT